MLFAILHSFKGAMLPVLHLLCPGAGILPE